MTAEARGSRLILGVAWRERASRAAVRLPAWASRCPLWPTAHQVKEAGLQRRVVGDMSR